MADIDWEAWLRDRFPGYLLREAAGETRPAEAVAAALERLRFDAGALQRLAQLGFLLDPAAKLRHYLEELLPRWLRHVRPESRRLLDERHGFARGRIDWARTLDLRRRTTDDTWFVGLRQERTFHTPELLAVRWLLARVELALRDAAPETLDEREGWVGELTGIDRALRASLAHASLRELPVERPSAAARVRCGQSRDEALQRTASLLSWHDELLPEPDGDALRATVARFSLAPLDVNRRFELFVLLAVIEGLDRVLGGTLRRTRLIRQGRSGATASWGAEAEGIEVHYDLGVPAGRHADVMAHYFDYPASVRPDVRIVRRRPGREPVELYLDAKRPEAEEPSSYLATSHLKMLGYLADRPGAFVPVGPAWSWSARCGRPVVCGLRMRSRSSPRSRSAAPARSTSSCGRGSRQLLGRGSRLAPPRPAGVSIARWVRFTTTRTTPGSRASLQRRSGASWRASLRVITRPGPTSPTTSGTPRTSR